MTAESEGMSGTRAWTTALCVAVVSLLVGTTASCSDGDESGASSGSESTITSNAGTSTDPLRILPLGDSITDGLDVPGGYRIALAADLDTADKAYDFVGSMRNGPPGLTDRDHEGHLGWRIDDITAIVADVMSSHEPDVVLLMIGTNDISHGHRLDTMTDQLDTLIDTITDADPEVSVYVSTVPPLVNNAAKVDAFNAVLPAVVDRARAAGHDVELVDAAGSVTLDELSDGVHPSAAGYAEIGHEWAKALLGSKPR
jgi:acyl-CoA thioesterase I